MMDLLTKSNKWKKLPKRQRMRYLTSARMYKNHNIIDTQGRPSYNPLPLPPPVCDILYLIFNMTGSAQLTFLHNISASIFVTLNLLDWKFYIVQLSKRNFSGSGIRLKALKNWSRPSISELGIPTQPWSVVYAKNQKRYNLHLLGEILRILKTLIDNI